MCFLILIHQSVKIISWPFFSATWVNYDPFVIDTCPKICGTRFLEDVLFTQDTISWF